jgi:hypothetical protein
VGSNSSIRAELWLTAAAMQPLWDRLVRADVSTRTWPRLLELARPLADTHFENPVELAPLWAHAATIEALDWPDDL